ncbi:myeloma-overexpressed gene 2 protein-like protein [Leptotrombidium deliense]|uniref:Myeloma-overexpressed gene 2 protein-like protein n=1 Tax=Leptotrombidium deliense TaxID=299467 RepID=A0A443SLH5_9ACAR|nr:myeloma-overexpressed gene 2 protein-like protein [Leptotrombidium deliense]
MSRMKPSNTNVVADEMFPEGGHYMDVDDSSAHCSNLMIDLTANEKFVHNDFFNNFDDLLDEDDLQ